MGEMIIGCEQVTKRFTLHGGRRGGTHVHAVNGVDLAVGNGEIVGLVGESGCGKSTISRILIGIEQATTGTIRFRGEPVTGAAGWRALRREVQYVFQDPYGSLPPRMTIGEILTDPLIIHGIGSKHERRQRVVATLEMVGLSERDMSSTPAAFSGGQRQRISIARALILDPRIVICDEVVSGLDVSVQAQVLNLLLDLRDRLDLGYLFISHDLRVVRYLCDRVAVMYLGQIVEEGPVEQIFEQPLHPYTVGLLAAVPDPATTAEGQLKARVPGEPPSLTDLPPGCPFASRCQICQPVCTSTELPRVTSGSHTVRCHFPGEASTHDLTHADATRSDRS